MDKVTIRSFVENNPNLVTMKKQSNGYYVLKYKNKVFYKNLWTPELLECRGTVVDENFNIIQRPFTKIYNLHERGSTIPRDEIVIASRKINGFMCAVTKHNGELLISTTGSCDSPFVELARQLIYDTTDIPAKLPGAVSWLFEIVHPEDPHIVKDDVGVYLLANRRKEWDAEECFNNEYELDAHAAELGCKRPEWYRAEFGHIQQWTKRCNHEGFVCYGKDTTLKMKSPYYLVTKFLARMRGEKLDTIINTNPDSLKERIDEEYYPLIDYIVEWKGMFTALDEQNRISFIEEYFKGQLDNES